MKKLLIILTALCFISLATNAQLWKLRRYEVSAGIGTTQFFGDIGGYSNDKNILGLKDFTFKQTRFNINSGIRYRITEDISIRANLVFGLFHSTDARGSNIERGFESSTMFLEPSLIGEYYFIKNKEENSFVFLKDKEELMKSFFASLDFYAFAGFGGLAYKVSPNNVLSPYVTKTGGFTGVVPLGIGMSLIYSGNINFGVELGGRFTFSDNLEGYTSPKSTANDVYHLLNFTFTYKMNAGKNGLPEFGK
jgi:hypothetical protein